jgi:flagellar basal body-associated protein FliL
MAEEEPQEEEGKKSGGMSGLIIMLVVSISAIGAGLSLPFVVKQLSASSVSPEEEEGMAVPDLEEEVDFIPFDEVTVNLAEARFSRFLQLSFSLQVAKSQREEIEKMVEAKKLIFKNWIQIHLAEKSVDDLKGFGRNQIRRELQDFFNKVLFDDGIERIQDVLFGEFHVQ